MQCSKCGAQVRPNAKRCPDCGDPILPVTGAHPGGDIPPTRPAIQSDEIPRTRLARMPSDVDDLLEESSSVPAPIQPAPGGDFKVPVAPGWELPEGVEEVEERVVPVPPRDDTGVSEPGKTRILNAERKDRRRTLVLKTTGDAALEYYEVVNAVFSVGRVEGDCKLPFDDYVSPKHAQFYYEAGQFFVRDLGSRNGTYRRLRDGESYEIADGETVIMGSQVFRFEKLLDQSPRRDAPPASLERHEEAAIDLVRRDEATEAATPDGPDLTDDSTWYLGSPDPRPAFRLVKVLRNQYDGPAYYHTWGPRCTIGRTKGRHQFQRDSAMSSEHAVIRIDADRGTFLLEDRDSTNGTFVRIRGPWALEAEDEVRIGEQVFAVKA